jgi:hypothetical protein
MYWVFRAFPLSRARLVSADGAETGGAGRGRESMRVETGPSGRTRLRRWALASTEESRKASVGHAHSGDDCERGLVLLLLLSFHRTQT